MQLYTTQRRSVCLSLGLKRVQKVQKVQKMQKLQKMILALGWVGGVDNDNKTNLSLADA